MWTFFYICLCSFVVAVAAVNELPRGDRPYLKVKLGGEAKLKCCEDGGRLLVAHWVKETTQRHLTNVQLSERISSGNELTANRFCGTLLFKHVLLNDTGMYKCHKNNSEQKSPGTYMQVYSTMGKTLKLSENTKNRILIVEGFLLFVAVLLPSFNLICKSKRLQLLEKKKALKEEENIYQGLTLDDRSSTYDQIERSQNHGPYQDVCNTQQDDIQLEKP